MIRFKHFFLIYIYLIMSGALLQLAALGSQDVYLTGNPEITLFKSSYQRHTHFSMETVQVTFDSEDVDFGESKITTSTFPKSGDLISKIILVIKLEECSDENIEWGYVNKLGHALIKEISVNIGQIEIDTHTSQWINSYHELFGNLSHEKNYNKMIGNVPELKNLKKTHEGYELYIPLEFWTCKSSSSAFPILTLNKQEFQISLTLRNSIDLINYKGNLEPSNLPKIQSAYFLVDYIFLDSPERQLFLKRDHEYLIEQVQEMQGNIISQQTKLNLIFDKPCKYLIWFLNLERYSNRNEFLVWSHDNNWDNALNNFAKLIWLSTRENLNVTDVNNPVIDLEDSYININQELPKISNGLEKLEKLAEKVKGIFLFADKNIVTDTFQAKATVDNVVLIENNITFEDMSSTIDELKSGLNVSLDQQITQGTFLDINKISIIDIFNYGNYLNRTDNPIILSRLQFNGQDKFQERDGNFFNYLNTFYYFNNTPPDGINAYSFCLSPNDIQPSGTINFSNINNKDLIVSVGKNNSLENSYFNEYFKNGTITIFTTNYTMLKLSPTKDLIGLTF